ncbi:hypothetical protein ANN_13043 [Periplaneta americana]|uniref:Mariner Mos1 transposase n=1 Tax=Periplaneta americana TaxID=6978 RepID=A0ABQ8TJA8_PERAM|nr:hypothetical protein ANN_13043 [Periplaneta americana]
MLLQQTISSRQIRCTVDKVAQNLNISHGSAYSIIHDRLKYCKVSTKWVPKCLAVDLSPCDFQIFGKLKSDLRRRQFAMDSDLIEAVQQWCHQQPKDFYEQGIKNLVSRWDKCLNTDGDYSHFEK